MDRRRSRRIGTGLAVATLSFLCLLEAAAEDKVKLEIDLPKAQFQGTPPNAQSKILDPQTGKKRRPFGVPKGVTSVALGRKATSSDGEPIIGELEMVTDGDKEADDGSFIEMGLDLQWIQIDLATEYEIYAILVWHYHQEARIYHDVVVLVSNDPDFVSGVKKVFNNDQDNSAGLGVGKDYEYIETNEGRLIDCKGVKGRYVRLYSNGNTTNDVNNYIEVEVYGRPPK